MFLVWIDGGEEKVGLQLGDSQFGMYLEKAFIIIDTILAIRPWFTNDF